MIWLGIVLSTLILCYAALKAQEQYFAFKHTERKISNHLALSDLLEAELKSMKDLKKAMELLLIKNGLWK